MIKIRSVFVSEPINVGWIIERLMRDFAGALVKNGVEVRIGDPDDYGGEDVVLHSRFLYASRVNDALINSVFVTHVDDILKEFEIKREISAFDSFICMSPSDGDFFRSLGCPPNKIYGADLPHRGGALRPIKIAIFSERYSDGRKNEGWLIEFLEKISEVERQSLIICLIGRNWEAYCQRLAGLGVSYELYCYDRKLEGEYDFQKTIIQSMDYLLYAGFDAGAMCVYDGIAAGAKLIISDISYHKNLNVGALTFKNKAELFSLLNRIVSEFGQRRKSWNDRSIDEYCKGILDHWNETAYAKLNPGSDFETSEISKIPVAEGLNHSYEFYRRNYKPVTLRRFFSTFYRMLRKNIGKKR